MRFYIFLIAMISIALISCDNDSESNNPSTDTDKISGEWHFILYPETSDNDTTLVKGYREADFEEGASEVEEVFLYEDEDGNLTGFSHPFKFDGKREGSKVTINVYDFIDGNFSPEMKLSDMVKVSTMEMTIDKFGNMSGMGNYIEQENLNYKSTETYSVQAFKVGNISYADLDINNPNGKIQTSSILKKACDLVWAIDATLIGYLTGGVFRPIGNCGMQKDGGGYYIFGHTGPGSLLPIYTQTIYYPVEWSACKTRTYHFSITLRDEVNTIEYLRWAVQHKAPTSDMYAKMGFATLEEFLDAIDAFEKEFGGFGISIMYDPETNHTGVYVNHEKGNPSATRSHVLISTMMNHFEGISIHKRGKIYYYSGTNIHDTWSLRRSTFLTCNTPLLICYLIGTHKVNYD